MFDMLKHLTQQVRLVLVYVAWVRDMHFQGSVHRIWVRCIDLAPCNLELQEGSMTE